MESRLKYFGSDKRKRVFHRIDPPEVESKVFLRTKFGIGWKGKLIEIIARVVVDIGGLLYFFLKSNSVS